MVIFANSAMKILTLNYQVKLIRLLSTGFSETCRLILYYDPRLKFKMQNIVLRYLILTYYRNLTICLIDNRYSCEQNAKNVAAN